MPGLEKRERQAGKRKEGQSVTVTYQSDGANEDVAVIEPIEQRECEEEKTSEEARDIEVEEDEMWEEEEEQEQEEAGITKGQEDKQGEIVEEHEIGDGIGEDCEEGSANARESDEGDPQGAGELEAS